MIHWVDVEAGGVGAGGVVGIVNDDPMCVARNDIGVAGHSGAVGGGKGIVAHGVVLSVVPQCLDGVAVVIIHGGRTVHGAARVLAGGRLREAIHLPTIVRLPLGFVVTPISLTPQPLHANKFKRLQKATSSGPG